MNPTEYSLRQGERIPFQDQENNTLQNPYQQNSDEYDMRQLQMMQSIQIGSIDKT